MENMPNRVCHLGADTVSNLVMTWADHDHRARALLAPRRRLVWANRAAAAELARGIALRLEGGRIAASCPQLTAELDRITGPDGPDRARLIVPVCDGTDHMIVDAARFATDVDHIALQICPGTPALFDPDAALRSFGLTRAERDVASLLLEGATAREVASARRSAPDTVRAQIRSIYSKLGIGSRAELLRRLIPYFC
ncbi:helix-turn-helix transcriptional regulator [Sphingomonas changnyeongensis]|nr:helix-turn-helix transcriptional regulator [Sphingomonas changnyeongensis]